MKKIVLAIALIITFIVYIYIIKFKDWSPELRNISLNIMKNTELYMAAGNLDSNLSRGNFLSIEQEIFLLKNTECNNKKSTFKINNYVYAGVIHNQIVGHCKSFVDLEIESFDWFFHRSIIVRKFNTTCELRFSHGKVSSDNRDDYSNVFCWNKPLLPHL